MKTSQLTLHSALYQLQALNAAIRLTPRSIAIWSPNKRLPSNVRSTIQEHKTEVRRMIEACRIEVCPSAKLHRREWHFSGPEWTVDSATCAICQRLAAISEVRANTSNFDKIKVSVRVSKEERVTC
jgi:hypothetical protein